MIEVSELVSVVKDVMEVNENNISPFKIPLGKPMLHNLLAHSTAFESEDEVKLSSKESVDVNVEVPEPAVLDKVVNDAETTQELTS